MSGDHNMNQEPCAGRNCESTNPNLHSAECFEDYEKSTGMNDFKPDWDTVKAYEDKFEEMLDEIQRLRAELKQSNDRLHEVAKHCAEVEQNLAAPTQEPRCAVIVEVFGKDWRLDYMSLPVGKHKLYTQEYVYTTPPAAQRLEAVNVQLLEALEFIANRQDLMFAECSDAEEIIEVARAAIAAAKGEV